ncbi:MAG: mobile mystery protein B [Rhodocyclaceae bacterium]|nr:mobile mystery protein B [Rhodocyclaceae bacterium]
MNLDYPPGATPLDPDEAAGLIPSHIANHGQLNEWEMVNIIEGERWAFGRRHKNLLGNEFICALHKRMFGTTWRWAGKFRTTEKNIGVDPLRIQPALHGLCEDVKTQLECESYPLDEIAARFSHRLVAIHPFANGNGRLSRTMADLLLVQHGAARFSWGAGNLVADGEVRQRYLAALRAADGKDYGPLLAFVRS